MVFDNEDLAIKMEEKGWKQFKTRYKNRVNLLPSNCKDFLKNISLKSKRDDFEDYFVRTIFCPTQDDSFSDLIREEFVQRFNPDPNIQMPREEFLKKLRSEERYLILDFTKRFSDYLYSKRKGQFFSILGIGSNIKRNYEEEKKYFEENGYCLDDKIKINKSGVFFDIYREECKEVVIDDLLNHRVNDIDILVCLDKSSYRNACDSVMKDFCEYLKSSSEVSMTEEYGHTSGYSYWKNPFTNEIVSQKQIVSGDPTFEYTKKGCKRPLNIYYKADSTSEKIEEDLVDENPFSVVVRGNKHRDLESAILNGEQTGVFENPLFLVQTQKYYNKLRETEKVISLLSEVLYDMNKIV